MKKNLFLTKLTAFFLAVAMLVTAFNAVPAKAAGGYIESLGLKCDLAVGNSYTFKHGYAGIKPQNMKISIDDIRVIKADREGYNKMIFTVTFADPFKPSDDQIHSMVNAYAVKKKFKSLEGQMWCKVIDNNTGLAVQANKDFEMDSVILDEDLKYYYADDGSWVSLYNMWTMCVTTTYPESYDNLVIGVGAQKKIAHTKADDKFEDGKLPFGKSTFYKKNKNCSKWLRVSDYLIDEEDRGQYDYMSEVKKCDLSALADKLTDIKNYIRKTGEIDLEDYMFDNGIQSGVYCIGGEDLMFQHSYYGNWVIEVVCVEKNKTTAINLRRYENDNLVESACIKAKATDAREVFYTGYYTSDSLLKEKLPLVVAYVLKNPDGDMPYDIPELGLEKGAVE